MRSPSASELIHGSLAATSMPLWVNSIMQNHSNQPPSTQREKLTQAHPISVKQTAARHGTFFPFKIAAPSFVIPAGAAENSRFLAQYFQEVGLLFFETDACLRYTDFDLPKDLTNLPVSWHVHLPLDLPWAHGFDNTWSALADLMEKAKYLSPQAWVLHPPTESGMLRSLAARLRDNGIDPATVLLENVDESDLCALWDEAREAGFSTCLDLGHIMAYGQHSVLELPGLWDTVRMLHVYAPTNRSKHTGLRHLSEEGQMLLKQMIQSFKGETLMLEVFDEVEIFDSLNLLAKWMNQWSEMK